MSKNNRKRSGFADTKEVPHKKHPAYYKNRKGDDIEYLTFTHHDLVNLGNKEIKTRSLSSNINPKERGKSITYVYPKVYRGKRGALGKRRDDLSFVDKDKEIIEQLFNELPVEEINYTSNSKKKKKEQ